MTMQKLLNNPNSVEWVFRISRWLSPAMGRWAASWISKWIASKSDLQIVKAIRCNQWVAEGENVSAEFLDQQVVKVLNTAGISFYNLFHNFESPEKLQSLVVFTPEIEEVIQRSREKRYGLVVAGIHISNFDLVAQAAALHGLKGFALSVPEPDNAIQWQHDLRRRSGLDILDANLTNLRLAIKRLQTGETVVTGIDRPVPNPKLKPLFFGRPAHLAVHHVQLALHAKIPVVVMGAIMKDDGRYHILTSSEIQMRPYTDRSTELIANAERILEISEEIIRSALDQWVVFQPIWPETLPLIPK